MNMNKFKYKHELFGGCDEVLVEKELAKNNIPAKVVWKFPALTIYCNRKNVETIQKAICMFRGGEPASYKNHLYTR